MIYRFCYDVVKKSSKKVRFYKENSNISMNLLLSVDGQICICTMLFEKSANIYYYFQVPSANKTQSYHTGHYGCTICSVYIHFCVNDPGLSTSSVNGQLPTVARSHLGFAANMEKNSSEYRKFFPQSHLYFLKGLGRKYFLIRPNSKHQKFTFCQNCP